MKHYLRIYLSAVAALLVIAAGCEQRTAPSKEEISKPDASSVSSTPEQLSSGGAEEPTASEPEAVSAQGIELTVKLAQDILDRGRVSFELGLNAPGGMGEFYQTHPDFLCDQSNRMQINTGKQVEDGGEHARLLLPEGRSPKDDLINRERLALFVENYHNKTPDSIVVLSSGEPIALWLTVFTYLGGDSYTVQSCYPRKDKLEWSPAYTVTQLEETDKEWILLNDTMQKIRFPKYGYEPIPFGEVTGVRTEAEVLALMERLREEQYPQTDSVTNAEPQVVDGVPCYVFEMLQSGEYTGYSFAVAKTLSRYYEIEQVNGRWVLQARPKSPEPDFAQRMSADLSGISTEWSAQYRNDSLGISINFPQSWENSYTPVFSEQRVANDEMAIRIDFCYKNDLQTSMACVIAMTESAWEKTEAEYAKSGGPGFGSMAGKNSSYVFSADYSHAPQYGDGPNREPCDKLSLAGRDAITSQITIYEPIIQQGRK